jgi:hypothetical protein
MARENERTAALAKPFITFKVEFQFQVHHIASRPMPPPLQMSGKVSVGFYKKGEIYNTGQRRSS